MMLCAAVVTGVVYWPALRGPFVFDDLYLPFAYPDAAGLTLKTWTAGMRPVLMFTYWLNYRLGGLTYAPYHYVNLVLHLLCGWLVYFILRRILEWNDSPAPALLALAASAIFLIHPVQTESVAYIAGRSDLLSAVFALGAFALYVDAGRGRLMPGRWAAIVTLVVLACLSKESCVVLPLVFLLTDLFWGGAQTIRDRRAFYGVLGALSAILAAFLLYRILPNAQAAGFRLKNLGPLQYFYTEFRAVWVYLRLFCLPVSQNADYDFPVSRTIFAHHAAIAGLALAGCLALAILVRRKFRLTAYGFILFLLLIAPTSSFIPILDPLVEHRLYLPSIGLLLALCGLLSSGLEHHARLAAAAAVLVLSALAFLAWQRNHVWSSPLMLWTDTAAKSPEKYRPRFQLAYADFQAGKCPEASRQYEQAARLGTRDYRLLLDWALAEDCAGQPENAIGKLKEAAALQPTAQVYSQIGLILGKQAKYAEAFRFLHQAEAADPEFVPTYIYRGMLYTRSGDLSRAAGDFGEALALDPRNETAAAALRLIQGRAPHPADAAPYGPK